MSRLSFLQLQENYLNAKIQSDIASETLQCAKSQLLSNLGMDTGKLDETQFNSFEKQNKDLELLKLCLFAKSKTSFDTDKLLALLKKYNVTDSEISECQNQSFWSEVRITQK